MITNVRLKGATRPVLLGMFSLAFAGNAQIGFVGKYDFLDQGVEHSAIAFADMDKDGDLDVFITGATGAVTKFGLYQMESQGYYYRPARLTPPFVATRHGSADFEDVDNDGFPDLLITGQTAEGVEIARLYKNLYANFREVPDTPFVGVTTSAAVFADFNNDGAPDVIIAGSSGGIPVTNLYYNDGQGSFSLSTQNNFTGVKRAAVAVADIDGDNDKDILIAGVTSESESVTLLYRNEGGVFSQVSGMPFPGVDDGSLAFGDVDADADADLMLMGTSNDGTIISRLYRNNGTGAFSAEENTPFPLVLDPQVALEDLDADGDLDIFMRGRWYTTKVFTNDGTGAFTEFKKYVFSWANYGSFEIADLDRDGLPEILMSGQINNAGYRTYLFQNITVLNKPPTVSEVVIEGIPEVGEELQGSYTFFDEDGDADQSVYRWYRSWYSTGTSKALIPGASSASYTPIAADENRYLSFEITPHDGTVAGAKVLSNFIGPVRIPVPEIGLTGNGVKIENGTGGPSLENHTLFDPTIYATASSLRTFVVENAGRAELQVSGITISGTHAAEFEVAAEIFPVIIGPGEEFEFSVNFSPSEAGERHALISIASNDVDEEIYNFEISGIGLNSPPEYRSEGIISFPENTEEYVLDVNATNGNGGAPDEEITYSLTGGADRDKFVLDSGKGFLSFIVAPDYEAPADADLNNEYLLEITADDGHSENNLSVQLLKVLVLNVDEAPEAICAEAFTLQLNASGEATITAADVDAGSSDDSGEFTVSIQPEHFTCAEIGENQVVLTVTDLSGNISTCTTTLTIEDNIAPEVLTKSIEIYLNTEGNAGITPTEIDSGSNDACGIETMSVSPDFFTCADVGQNTVTLKVTDNNGNIGSSTAVVTVVDNQLPLIGEVENVVVESQGSECGAYVDISAPASTDNCSLNHFMATRSDGVALSERFPVGTTTITWEVEDVHGNPAEPVVQSVVVTDTQAPVIAVVEDISAENEEGKCGAFVQIPDPEVQENCGFEKLIGVRDDGLSLADMFPVGTTSITWTAEDIHENPAEPVIQNVIISDTQAPVIAVVEDISVQNDEGQCGAFVQIPEPEIQENCSLEKLIGVRDDGLSLTDMFPVGTTSITWTAEDIHENPAEPVIQNVVISDTQAPVIAVVEDISAENEEGKCGAFVQIPEPEVQENCASKDLIGVRDDGLALTDMFPVGTTSITWTVEDIHKNPAEPVIQNVIVSDTQAPVIAGVEDILVENDAGICGAFVEIPVPEVQENCSLEKLVGVRDDGFALTDMFPVGITTITWKASDISMNSATPFIQRVNVADNELPVAITQNLHIELNMAGSASITAAEINNGSYDNCGLKSMSISQSTFTCADLGTNEVTFTVVDSNGNESKETANVFIIDNQLPEIGKIENIDVPSQEGKCGAIVELVIPEVTDNCGVEAIIGKRNDNLPLKDVFPVGKTTIIWSVKDLTGNEAADVVQTIIVRDNRVPVISQADGITAYTNGQCGAYVDIIAPSVSDDCETGVISGIRDDGDDLEDVFPIGTTKITWTVTDVHNNDALPVTQIIEVVDNERPVITAVDVIVESQPKLCGAFLEIVFPDVSDNCSAGPLSATRSDELLLTDIFPVGETTIVWSVQDGNGNWAEEVVQKIKVRDKTVPVISEAAGITAFAGDQCGAYVDVVVPKVSDDCETGALLGIRDDGKDLNAMFDVGTTIITWTVTDKNGNSAEPVFQEVKVMNETPRDVIFTTVDVPQEIGTAITVRAIFQDENISSASWKAFNGTSVIQRFVDEDASGNEVSHTFYDLPAGVYSIILELKDHCGVSSGEIIYEYIVLYDPDGGFVTGGGWIISPENPDYEYMQKSGKANFGFNAKYKNGNNNLHEVGGNTNFQFKAGNLHFKSSSHDDMSLVISGGFKATYKGRGTINGRGDYRFMLTAIDAEQSSAYYEDLFRIKIWETGSNKVVYDNNVKNGIITEADNADPVTSIGGGSIVIHRPKSKTKNLQEVMLVPEILPENVLEIIQIYPNPMKNRAVVLFSLDAMSREADLRIYDMNGKEVIQLFRGRVEENKNYEVVFERGNLMAGVYICRLTTEKGKVYQKRLLLQ